MTRSVWALGLQLISIFIILFCAACNPSLNDNSEPVAMPTPTAEQTPENDQKYLVDVGFYFNPSPIVNFKTDTEINEDLALFTSEAFLINPDSVVKEFQFTFNFDPTAIMFQNIMCPDFLCHVDQEYGQITVSAENLELSESDYSELFSVTWRALRTSFAEVRLHVDKIILDKGLPDLANQDFTAVEKILLPEAKIFSESADYSVNEGEKLREVVSIMPQGHRIFDFDFVIEYDAKRLAPDNTDGSFYKIILQNFDIQVEFDDNKIHITGISETGLPETAASVVMLYLDFWAIDSGLASVSINVERMVTLDDVYLNPAILTGSVVITPNDGTPPMKFWFEPSELNVSVGEYFSTVIRLDTLNYNLAAYGLDVYFDSTVVDLDKNRSKSVIDGADGYIAAYNSIEGENRVRTTGFSIGGISGNNLEFLIIYWQALAPVDSTTLELKFKSLTDNGSLPIPRVESTPLQITIRE